jgi:hypothetical protein
MKKKNCKSISYDLLDTLLLEIKTTNQIHMKKIVEHQN